MGPKPRPIEERFWEKVRKTPGCWLWTAWKDTDGYGKFRVGSRTDGTRRVVRAHVFSFALVSGEPHNQVLHTCDNPACVRPDHLYDGTPVENGRDVRIRKRHPKAQLTHCKYGHPFDAANTYRRPNGTRCCRACNTARKRRTRE